jgi:membrane-bound serine protease (ClpP class)
LAVGERAAQEKKRGVLVLQIGNGSSPFHQIRGLAKFLADEVPAVLTVAWVGESVTGDHAVLALACQEIIMHPDAVLGDISLGTPLEADEETFVLNLADRRKNRKVNKALVAGLLDRGKEVLWAQVELKNEGGAGRETRILSPAGYEELRNSGAQIIEVKTIKVAGAPGVFSGDRARELDILAMHKAQSRDEVAALYRLPRESMREDSAGRDPQKAIVIKIDGTIDPLLEQFVLRQVDRAMAAGSNLLIFEIDSPGGRPDSSIKLAHTIAYLDENRVRTIAYIPHKADSGGAFIALACDEIYMRPEARLGDAARLENNEGGGAVHVANKALIASLRELAEKKRRSQGLAQAMADKDVAVFEFVHQETSQIAFMDDAEFHAANGPWKKGRQIAGTGQGELLLVDARTAHTLKLAEAPVQDFDDLKSRLGLGRQDNVPVSARTWVDSLIFALNSRSATVLLFVVGLMCLYFEAHFPSGFFGICASVCFGLFFWSRFLGGTAGWLEIVLFVLGAALLAIEIFLLPGFGIFGISGIVLCVSSLVLASQTFIIPASNYELKQLTGSVFTIGGSVAGVVVLASIFSRFLPRIPLYNSMILTPPGAEEPGVNEPRLRPEPGQSAAINPLLERDQALVGKQGVAVTVLRPSGRAMFDEEFVDVVSEGPYISSGRKIEVLAVSGNRVIVREIA